MDDTSRCGGGWTQDELNRILANTFVEQVEHHQEIGSTNDRALQLAGSADSTFPLLVLAERQTAGRGRGANRWWASQGALTFSLVLATQPLDLSPARWPQASLTAGLAVCEALESLLDESEIQLKWPNDVYVRQRKVCGILIESSHEHSGLLVVGIGLNVNNSVQQAPQELRGSAIALCDVVGAALALVDVLEQVLLVLAERLSWIGSRDGALQQRWRARCLLTDRMVRLTQGARQIEGLCRGIDDQGALMVETAAGLERCVAGVVTHF